MPSKKNQKAYWKANLKLMGVLLSIWFIVSFGCGILFVEQLNQIQFYGFKLGFWMAQQGSLYVFLILIFVYAKKMDSLDKKYSLNEDQE
jgi:putative solute:sodium symporter small subunit